jgi:hypothetical protein
MTNGNPMMKLSGTWAAAALALASMVVQAEPPSFDDFFRGVAQCSLDMNRYRPGALLGPQAADGVLIALPTSGAVRGFLVSSFYFAPGRSGGDSYGLVFNAPLEAVAGALPELAGRQTVNGHLRRMARLSDETGDRSGRRKTLLVCTGGTEV